MIANITQGSYVSGLLEYHKDKVEQGKAKVFMLHNLLSDNPKYIENTLSVLNFDSNRKDKNIHISLNFLPEDYQKLSEKSKQNIVKDYIKQIGFPQEHPYVVYLHNDKKHPHFHIVTSKILSDKKVLKDSFLHYNSQRITRDLEKKYGLNEISSQKNTVADIRESFNQEELNLLQQQYKNAETPLKDYLKQSIEYVLEHQKPIHLQQLESYLESQGIHLYQTTHKEKGIIFSEADKTKGIAASKLSSAFTYRELQKIFKTNREQLKPELQYIARNIDWLFFKYDKIDIKTYQSQLKKKDIEIKLNVTNGILRGISYQYNGRKYKGQDLPGRRYTQDKIKDKFGSETKYNDLYQVKLRMFLNTDKINYSNLNTFIATSLSANIRPVIYQNNLYLLPIENKETRFNLEKSVQINDFDKELLKMNDQEKSEINTLIYKDILNANTSERNNLNNGSSEDTFEQTFYNSQSDQDNNTDEPMKKKKKKRQQNI